MEPVFHGGLPALLWKNVLQAYGAKGVIDLSAGEGEVCKAAMQLRKPCLALCMSDVHVRLLFDHLVTWMLANMLEQGSIYYNVAYKSFKTSSASAAQAVAVPALDPVPKPAKPQKRNSENNNNNKPKKKTKREDPSENSSSSSDE